MSRVMIGLAMACALTACNNSNVKDLKSYVDEVKSQQQSKIEPLPEFAPYETYLYSANTERDPFTPPKNTQRKKELAKAGGNGLKPDFNRPREPLETEPLDSLRMVGTLEKKGRKYALIRMGDSTIHRVKPGNYAGQNFGKIVRISESEVEVMEIIPDGLGGWMERPAKLALSE